MNNQPIQFVHLVSNIMDESYTNMPEALREKEKTFKKMTKRSKNSRIMYPFALDLSSKEVIYILDADQSKKYVCLDCKQTLIPRALESVKRYAHFYHKNIKDRLCEESFEHYYVKNNLSIKLRENIGKEINLWLWYLVDEHQAQVNLMENVTKVELEYAIKDNLGAVKARSDIALLDKENNVLWAIEVVNTHRIEKETLEFYKNSEINCIEVYVNRLTNYDIIHYVGEPVPVYDGSVFESIELKNNEQSIDYKARLVIRNSFTRPPESKRLDTLTALLEIKGKHYKKNNKIQFYLTGEDLLNIFEFLRDNQELINFLIAQRRKEERGKYDKIEHFKELETIWRRKEEKRKQTHLDEDFFNVQ